MILQWVVLAAAVRLTVVSIVGLMGVGRGPRPRGGSAVPGSFRARRSWAVFVGHLSERWALPWDVDAVVRHRRAISTPGGHTTEVAAHRFGVAVSQRLVVTASGTAVAAWLLDQRGFAAILAPAVAVLGFAICDMVEACRWRSSRRRARNAVPLCLEIWSAAATSAATSRQALAAATSAMPPPIRAVCQRGLARQALGESLLAAVADEARHAEIEGLADVASRLARAANLGLPIGGQLEALAADMRDNDRRNRVRRAGRAVPLATLVSAMVIAPACVAFLGLLVIGAGMPTLSL